MAFVLWARFVAVKKGLYSRQIHINCYFSKIMECVIDILYLCVNRETWWDVRTNINGETLQIFLSSWIKHFMWPRSFYFHHSRGFLHVCNNQLHYHWNVKLRITELWGIINLILARTYWTKTQNTSLTSGSLLWLSGKTFDLWYKPLRLLKSVSHTSWSSKETVDVITSTQYKSSICKQTVLIAKCIEI